jgi:hypothetical protein
LPDALREDRVEQDAGDYLPKVRGEEKRDSTVCFQRGERVNQRRFGQVIQRIFWRWRRKLLRWRRLRLPLISGKHRGVSGLP